MKVVQKFRCEVCHTEYAAEKAALECEASNKLPLTIVNARHLSMGQNGPGYPVSITVRMSDGKDITYKR